MRAGLRTIIWCSWSSVAPPAVAARAGPGAEMLSMCQCGACAARHDGGVTRLKYAASWDSTIRSAYPSRRSAWTVAIRVMSGEDMLHPNRSIPMVAPASISARR